MSFIPKDQIYTIAVIDDETTILTVLNMVLTSEGYTVHSFTRALAALTFIQQNKVHLVISDFQIPEMNGIEFVRRLRSTGWNGIYYILSGHAHEIGRMNWRELGIDYIISKPFDLFTLRQSIRDAFQIIKCH